jgi:molybdopterin synthase sulfur carrier subunit
MPTIKLFARLRTLAGCKELRVNGASLGEALDDLIRQQPALEQAILSNGQIRPHMIININGSVVQDLEMPVTEQDIIAIFPPIAGG